MMAIFPQEVAVEIRDHLTLEALLRLQNKKPQTQRAKRLRIIILAIQGFTAPAIALSLGLSRRAVQEWVERFNREGLQGLCDRRGGNRRKTLTEEQKAALCRRLDQGPSPEDSVCLETGRAEGLLSPRLNTDVINIFLGEARVMILFVLIAASTKAN